MNQAWPVAPADLQQVLHCGCEGPGCGAMLPHGPKQPVPPSLHGSPCLVGVIVQEVRGAMDPARGPPALGPPRRRRIPPPPQERSPAP